MEAFSAALQEFHFLRPPWLLLALPAIGLFFVLRHYQLSANSWAKVIAPELLPFMLNKSDNQRRSNALLWLSFWLIGALALAGPSWEKIPLPVHKSQQPLVILFDLSPSMLVEDIKPNRLARAKLKLIDLLNQRKEGTTALISYAGEAFVVSPLTDDTDTIANMVPALHPNILPVAGSQAEQALQQALQLIKNTGERSGDILFITDGINLTATDEINRQLRNNPDIRLSILGIGTTSGGPIPLGRGGFAKDNQGSIVIPKLEPSSLTRLAARHNGLCVTLAPDNSDLDRLFSGFNPLTDNSSVIDERTTDTWHDLGYWLVLPLLILLVPMFRRGSVVCLLLIPALLPQPTQALQWQDLWLTKDQQAAKALQQGNAEQAQRLFKNSNWKAASAYQAGDYESASQLYKNQFYNQGNALAKQGKLQEALKAYEQALLTEPDMDDAHVNKQIVEELLKQQQKNDENDSSDNQQNEGDQSQQNQDGQPQQNDQKNPSDSNPGDSNSDNSNADQQQSENSGEQSKPQQNDSNGQSEQGDSKQDQQPNKQNSDEKEQQADSQNESQNPTNAKQNPSDQKEQQALKAQPDAGDLTDEERQQMDQWLRKIPDDPGGLLRKKFQHQSRQRAIDEHRGLLAPSEKQQRW